MATNYAEKATYPKQERSVKLGCGILQPHRTLDHKLHARPPLPGTVIVVHGVNDVGVSYGEVEAGLCAGLGDRLRHSHAYQPATYRVPQADDRDKLLEDPDAVFFKRQASDTTHSPVIPFYWGYREVGRHATAHVFRNGKQEIKTGQFVDRYGNRLDKDRSKGGGPFANATSALPDMWNRGFSALPGDLLDRASGDALRPVLKAPGRMYMVLAAQRLAALVAMIRDYHADETVNLVAHSQGCMLSLLAQAILMHWGLRPADTLVLTHPPYSLVDDVPVANDLAEAFSGGEDAAMQPHYGALAGRQTFHARLQTLARIVDGVAKARHAFPALAELKSPQRCGVVSAKWEAAQDRDNRGKVYLYFCPEDMTVALDNVQGIGWQGVPDQMPGSKLEWVETTRLGRKHKELQPVRQVRDALAVLGKGFFQRVFTTRLRAAKPGEPPTPVLVGAPPHDHILRLEDEDDHGHVDEKQTTLRSRHEETAWPPKEKTLGFIQRSAYDLRRGIRRITGEALKVPVQPDMQGGAKYEDVDPIDAAIATTSRYGRAAVWQLIDDTQGLSRAAAGLPAHGSPREQALFKGPVGWLAGVEARVAETVNAGLDKDSTRRREVSEVFACLEADPQTGRLHPNGKLLVQCLESPDEARLRWQKSQASRSFHGAIFGSRLNHRRVTAYDLSIGQGEAVDDPDFRAYLCAVADWRLQGNLDMPQRKGILRWPEFEDTHGRFYRAEPAWRKALIKGNADYYGTGVLPACLPVLAPGAVPPAILSETMLGRSLQPTTSESPQGTKTAAAEPQWELPELNRDDDGGFA